MTSKPRTMNINIFFASAGYFSGSWRREGSRSEELLSFAYMKELARQAEAAKVDAIFVADSMAHNAETRATPNITQFEPVTLLSALAGVTSHLGLMGTMSTTFTEPFNLARYLQSLDHLSGGRVGWNIVTSAGGQENFGVPLPPHDERYVAANEYMRVVTALWDSWDDDAVVNDRASGIWVDPKRVHQIDHHGRFFNIRGPAHMPRSPQGWPVLVQAGASPAGMAFAARYAEVIFTAAPDMAHAQSFYRTVKDKVAEAGREPGQARILPGMLPVIGETEKEARALADELIDLIPISEGLRALRTDLAYIDVASLDLDQPVPLELFPDPSTVMGNRSRYELYREMAVDQRKTLRELARMAGSSMGHSLSVGTVEQVADEMQRWFTQGGCDGFNVQIAYSPGGMADVCEKLVPELVSRGLFRSEYDGTTLRDHLGLPRPEARRG
jgi:N-acetyl-S-(2-succino)cysteine monooxygenase